MTPEHVELLVAEFVDRQIDFQVFADGIRQWFMGHAGLRRQQCVHSVKHRLKDVDHLREKLQRKFPNVNVPVDEFFVRVTDLAGVRVLHLHQAQFEHIHAAIRAKVASNDWVLAEEPKAFTWDPEARDFFVGLGLSVEVRDTHYTSVHYLVRPRADSPVCCEIQVRTLFEEIWGEVDHQLNYPSPTQNLSSREQLRVLTKVVGAGSRLLDSIFRTA